MDFSTALKNGAIAGVSAAGINALMFYVGSAVGCFPPTAVVQGQGPIGIANVLLMSVLPCIIGAVIFALLCRFTSNAVRIFQIVTGVVFALFLTGPITGITGVATREIVLLEVMHLVVAGACVYFLTISPQA